MKHRPYVVFDLDDVLANLRDHLMTMLNRRTGRSVHWREWHQYELSSVYGAPVEAIMTWVREDAVLEAATLEPHAQAAIQAARAVGYRVAIVTARGWHPAGEQITRDWLRRHDLDIDSLHLVAAFGEKADVLRGLGPVVHFIDDHVGHLYPARSLAGVRQVHLLDRPWNRHDTVLPRLRGLEDLIDLLEEGSAR